MSRLCSSQESILYVINFVCSRNKKYIKMGLPSESVAQGNQNNPNARQVAQDASAQDASRPLASRRKSRRLEDGDSQRLGSPAGQLERTSSYVVFLTTYQVFVITHMHHYTTVYGAVCGTDRSVPHTGLCYHYSGLVSALALVYKAKFN